MMEYVPQRHPAEDLPNPLRKPVEVQHRLIIANAPHFPLNASAQPASISTALRSPPPNVEAPSRIDGNHGIFPLAANAPDYSPLYARLQNCERAFRSIAPIDPQSPESATPAQPRFLETQWPAPSFLEALQSRGIYMTRTYSPTPDSLLCRPGEDQLPCRQKGDLPQVLSAAVAHRPSPESATVGVETPPSTSSLAQESRNSASQFHRRSDAPDSIAGEAFSAGVSPLPPNIRASIEQPLDQLWASHAAQGKDTCDHSSSQSQDEGFEELRTAMRGGAEDDDGHTQRKENLPKFSAGGEMLQHSSRFGGPRPNILERGGSEASLKKSTSETEPIEPTDIEGWRALCREERESKKVLESRIQSQASTLSQLQQELDKEIARAKALERSHVQSQNEAEESRRELQNLKHSLRGRKDCSNVESVVSTKSKQLGEQALESALQEALMELEAARQQNASLRFLLQNASQEKCDKQLNNEVKHLRQQHLTASTLLSRWGHFATGLQRIIDDQHLQPEKKIEELRIEVSQVVKKGISKYEPQKGEQSAHGEADPDQHIHMQQQQPPPCQTPTHDESVREHVPAAGTALKACPATKGESQCSLRGGCLKKKRTPTCSPVAGRITTESSEDSSEIPRSVMDRIKDYEATH